MKKYIITVLTIVLVFSMILPVGAAAAKYVLPELGLSLAIPSEYDVFTRDMDADDPLFSKYNISRDDLMEHFASGSTYLDAVAPDGSEEIVVVMTKNSVEEFNSLGDTALMALSSELQKEYENYGLSVSSYDLYHHSQLIFIRIYFNTADKSTYGLQYYTIYGNKAMNFTLRSYTGPISAAQENTMLSVVDSICMDSYSSPNSPAGEAPAFTYTDRETGVIFLVPENWKQEEFSKERQYIDAKFVSLKDPGLTMMYGSTDLWAQMSASERAGYTRSDFDHTLITASDIAQMLGTTAPVKCVTYNGREYYQAEVTTETEAYGASLSVTMTHAIRIENGWIYWFQFGGTSQSEYFDDFERMISGARYPEIKANSNSQLAAGAIVTAAVAAIVIAIVLLNKRRCRGAAPQNAAGIAGTECVVCQKCGAAMPKDSCFCMKCGTKNTEEGELL